MALTNKNKSVEQLNIFFIYFYNSLNQFSLYFWYIWFINLKKLQTN